MPKDWSGSYGGRSFKKGGGSLKSPGNEGNKGVLKGGSFPGKSKLSGGLESPSKKGNKGVDFTGSRKPKSGAPLD